MAQTKIVKIFLLTSLLFSTLLFSQTMSKMDLINAAKKEVGEITPKELKKLLDEGEDVIILDVRESEQRAEGSIPYDDFNKENFYAITRGNLEWEAPKLLKEKDALIVTYCRRGGRGALAAEVLKKMGYTNVHTLQGGLKGWAKANMPVKTGLGIVTLQKAE